LVKKIYDIVVIGGGASGLMFCSMLPKSLDVAIVELNQKEAKKLKISGGGKCNITNVDMSELYFDADPNLIEYALSIFSKEMLLEFLEQNGITPVIRKNRYYFCKDSSDEIIDILKSKTKHIERFLNTTVTGVKKDSNIFEIFTNKDKFLAKKVVVASGSKSFAQVGVSDIGLEIAKSFNIEVEEFSPALVGLTLQKEQFWMKELSGLSCSVEIEVENRILKEDMLFTHKGISGPAVLSTSLYWKKGDISINFLPNLDVLEVIKNSQKLISSTLPLPKRLSKALLKALDIKDQICLQIDKKTEDKLLKIHSYRFSPAGNFGFSKAEVCRGGVLAKELDIYSLEAKKVKDLYFIGEVVDVTGELGGYNIQWAFSSAVVCASSILL